MRRFNHAQREILKAVAIIVRTAPTSKFKLDTCDFPKHTLPEIAMHLGISAERLEWDANHDGCPNQERLGFTPNIARMVIGDDPEKVGRYVAETWSAN